MLYPSQIAEYQRRATESGRCEQCVNPWFDGMCECDPKPTSEQILETDLVCESWFYINDPSPPNASTDPMTDAWILFDTKAMDARPVNGHTFYASREPLDDYRNSGSEWIQPEHLEVVAVKVSANFTPYVPVTAETFETEDPFIQDDLNP